MTAEEHALIVQYACHRLLLDPVLATCRAGECTGWITPALVREVRDHPRWQDPEDAAARQTIREAAALLRQKTQEGAP